MQTLTPVTENDNWQIALFNQIVNEYGCASEALFALKRIYEPDDLYYFDDYAISVSALTKELIKDIFNAKEEFDLDILQRKLAAKLNRETPIFR